MNETEGNSFDTTTPQGRIKEILTVVGLKFPREEHQNRFLDGQWKDLGEETPRNMAEASEDGFKKVKAFVKTLAIGEFPEPLNADKPKDKRTVNITEMKLG